MNKPDSVDDSRSSLGYAADCECASWGRDSLAAMLHLPHHPNCAKYKPEKPVRALLLRLIAGIETWASDEDGVHADCWDAYKDACAVVGMRDRPPSDQDPV